MSRYYDRRRSEGPDLEEGAKVWLLYKNFNSKRLSKKLDYVKIGLFKILKKVIEVTYKLDLLLRMKIYPVQYVSILEPVHGNLELLAYESETYRGQEEDE